RFSAGVILGDEADHNSADGAGDDAGPDGFGGTESGNHGEGSEDKKKGGTDGAGAEGGGGLFGGEQFDEENADHRANDSGGSHGERKEHENGLVGVAATSCKLCDIRGGECRGDGDGG